MVRPPLHEHLATLLTAADDGWLRSMARRLADDSAADDLVQELWLTSARRPPRAEAVEPWLRRVARRLLRQRWRSETRRKRREVFAVDRSDAVVSPEEEVARAELERIIVAELAGLRPARRQVLELHFLQGYPTPEIARRLALPAGTVRRRIKEGIDELRAALDRRYGGRREVWLRALVPVAGLPNPRAADVPTAAARRRFSALPAAALTVGVVGLVALSADRAPVESDWPAHQAGDAAATARLQPVRFAPEVTTAAPGSGDEGFATIGGEVRTVEGDPVVGARLNLVDVGARKIVATAASGADGRFEIAAAAGRYHVSAVAPAGWAGRDLGAVAAGGRAHATLIVAPGVATITGRVSSSVSGAALGGAQVTAVPLGGGAERFAAEADQHGRYALRVPRGRRYQVYADAPLHNVSNLFPSVLGDRTVDLPLFPLAKISGRVVVAASGRPSPAQLTVVGEPYPGEEPLVQVAPIDATGTFELAVSPGHYRLYAQHGGRVGASNRLTAAPGATASTEIALGEGTRLRGRVVGPSGEGVAGATVVATVTDPSLRALGARAATAADGRFELTALPQAELAVTARAPGHLPATAQLPVAAITTGWVPELRLVRSGRLQGHVRDASGAPVAGVLVRASFQRDAAGAARASSVRTDELGAFALDGGSAEQAEHVWLAAQHVDGSIAVSGPFPIRADEVTSAQLALGPGGFIEGRAVHPDGAPAKEVAIDAIPVGNPAAAAFAVATFSDGEGRFRVGPLPAGRIVVQLGWRAQASQLRNGPWPNMPSREVNLAPGEDRGAVALTVPRSTGHITGQVLDPAGAPLANAVVDVGLELPETARVDTVTRVFSDPSGRFDVRELPPGQYRLVVRYRPFADEVVSGLAPSTDGLTVRLGPVATAASTRVSLRTR